MNWIKQLFSRRQLYGDLSSEIQEHLAEKVDELVAEGMSREEATFAARREFGNVLGIEERSREVWCWTSLENFAQDIRYGLRMLARKPGVTGVMVATLAIAIGATTAIFSVVYGVLLRQLPYPRPDRIVSLREVAADGHSMNFADPNFADLHAMNHTLAAMAKCTGGEETVSDSSGSARVMVYEASRDFFQVMGVSPLVGRSFSADELRQGGTPAVLASYGYWRQHLGGSTDLAPFKLRFEDHIFSVVGVMPPGFDYPAHTQLWIAAEFFGDQSPSRTSHNWPVVVGRLRDSVNLKQARSELSTLARVLSRQYQPNIDMRDVSVLPLRSALTASVRPALLILLGAVGFLLLVGCANVANLLLARASERGRELAVRSALGASRARLMRQFLAESVLLSFAGGALGIVLAWLGVNGLLALAPPNLPRIEEVSVNLQVLAFALGVLVLVSIGLGTVTAVQATSHGPQPALAEGGRGAAGSLAAQRFGGVLVAGQIAITLVLLAGAGLLGRSLLRVLSVDPGFRTSNIVTMELEVPASQPVSTMAEAIEAIKDTRPASFMSNLFDRLHAFPGVEQVGGVSVVPLAEGGDCPDGKFLLLDRQPQFNPANPEDEARLDRLWSTAPGGEADYCVASAGYFQALGIPLLRGRLFGERDTANAPHVAMISQSLARATWPNQDPLGRTLEFGNMDGDMRLLTVVGIVGDVHARSLEKPLDPIVYVDYRQRLRGGRDFTVVMRAALPANVLLANARRVVRDLAPDVAPRFQSFEDVFSASLSTRRFNLTLIGVFAATALLLAAVGIYGVMAYWVARRTREFGVRMALGARPRNVLKLVLSHSLRTLAIGMVIGLIGAFALTRTMQSLLFEVTAADPLTFAGVALMLGAVALLACYIPARRATKVDPMVALRYE
jgi:predicted permease